MAGSRDAQSLRSVPWIAEILRQPDLTQSVVDSRERKGTNEDALMGSTFNSADTVSAILAFWKTPGPDTVQIDEVNTLMKVGTGLDGWPQIMHGGIVATIIDEAMGILLFTNQRFHAANPGRNDGPNKNMNVGHGSFTAELKITYKAPVVTPGDILIKTRYLRRDGRKDWLYSEVIQFDEKTQKQVVCSIGEALFIARKARL